MSTASPARPRLAEIFMLFLRIGAVSFGGGMSAWIRREVVLKQGWLEDRQFLAGLALCQITPGANGVNIAIFTGSLLRGGLGACAAFFGLMAIPFVVLLVAGGVYFANQAAIRNAGLGAALAELVERLFGSRVLAFDQQAALVYAPLVNRARTGGRIISVADGQIAAIAAVHGFAVATRDTEPFVATGVAVINPWEA